MSEDTTVNLRDVARREELTDNLEIIGGKNTLDDFLMGSVNFARGNEIGSEVNRMSIEAAPLEIGSLAGKAISYANKFVERYEDKSYDLFSKTLDLLSLVPEKKRWEYANIFEGIVEKDINEGGRSYILPAIIDEVVVRLSEKYASKRSVIIGDEGEDVAAELMGEIDRVIEYAKVKLEQNERYDTRATDISYEGCFPDSIERDYSALTPAYVMEIMGNGGGHQEMIDTFGAPIGMAVKGIRNEKGNTIVLYFGNENMQHRVPVEHPNGLGASEKGFYVGLAGLAIPIPALESTTRKAMSHLTHGNI